MRKVFEENLVAKMSGKPENELSNNATIRFELDNVHYTVKINEDFELEIYKVAKRLPQTNIIVLTATSSNVFCIK